VPCDSRESTEARSKRFNELNGSVLVEQENNCHYSKWSCIEAPHVLTPHSVHSDSPAITRGCSRGSSKASCGSSKRSRESSSAFAGKQAASKRLVEREFKKAEGLIVSRTKPDKWDRYLADVFLRQPGGAELYLNNLLLSEGYARRMGKVTFADWGDWEDEPESAVQTREIHGI
jgi:hypothetical protein